MGGGWQFMGPQELLEFVFADAGDMAQLCIRALVVS